VAFIPLEITSLRILNLLELNQPLNFTNRTFLFQIAKAFIFKYLCQNFKKAWM